MSLAQVPEIMSVSAISAANMPIALLVPAHVPVMPIRLFRHRQLAVHLEHRCPVRMIVIWDFVVLLVIMGIVHPLLVLRVE